MNWYYRLLLVTGMGWAVPINCVGVALRSDYRALQQSKIIDLHIALETDEVGIYKDDLRAVCDVPWLRITGWNSTAKPDQHYDFAFNKAKKIYEAPFLIQLSCTVPEGTEIPDTGSVNIAFSCLVHQKNGRVNPCTRVVTLTSTPPVQDQTYTQTQGHTDGAAASQAARESFDRLHVRHMPLLDTLIDTFASIIAWLGHCLALLGALGLLIMLWVVGVWGKAGTKCLPSLLTLGIAAHLYLLCMLIGHAALYLVTALWCLAAGIILLWRYQNTSSWVYYGAHVLLVAVLPLLVHACLRFWGLG